MRRTGIGSWTGALAAATAVVVLGIVVGAGFGTLTAAPQPGDLDGFEDYAERALRAAQEDPLRGFPDHAERMLERANDTGAAVEGWTDYAERQAEARRPTVDGWEDYAERLLRQATEGR